jgi:hypothetical protein
MGRVRHAAEQDAKALEKDWIGKSATLYAAIDPSSPWPALSTWRCWIFSARRAARRSIASWRADAAQGPRLYRFE